MRYPADLEGAPTVESPIGRTRAPKWGWWRHGVGGGGGGHGGGGYVLWLAGDGCDRGVDGTNHDDADCNADAGGDCDAAVGVAADAGIAVADVPHPASNYRDPQTNTSAIRSGYRS